MGGPTTVFVRNLPYTCTDAGLEEAFSEIGPVKECFIIADKGAGGRSKGFGFVHFALAEDAAAAVAKSTSFQIDGRAVTIDIAKQKPSAGGAGAAKGRDGKSGGGGGGGGGEDEDDVGNDADGGGAGGDDSDSDSDSDSDAPKAKSAPPPRQKQQQHQQRRGPGAAPGGALGVSIPAAAHPALKDADKAARTVAVGGLRLAGEPEGIDPDAALDAAKACGGAVEEIVSPAPPDVVSAAKLRHDGCTRGVVLVVYATADDAKNAVSQLHRTFPGVGKRKQQRLKAQLAEGGVAAAKAAAAGKTGGVGPDAADASVEMIWARQLGGCEGAKPKSWRVIIRNLAFKATDEDIRKACGVAGFVWDLTVPRDFHRKPKGFAFAAYTSKADAEAAVKRVNGAVIAGRPVAVDWALSKHSYAEAQQKAEGVQEKRKEKAEDDDDDDEGEDDDEDDESSEDDSGSGSSDDEGDDDMDVDGESSSGESSSEGGDNSDDDDDDEGEDGDAMTRRVMNMVMDNPDAEENPAAAAEAGKLGKKMGSRREAREAAKAEREQRAKDANEAKARQKADKAAAAGKNKSTNADSDADSDGDDAAPPPRPGKGGKGQTASEDGASVFVRDVPTEASKQMLYDRMQKFGKVRSCRLVVDKATGRAKGTAFVDFHDPGAARAAVEAAAKVEGGGVKVAGRRVQLALAVSASEAAGLAANKAKEEASGRAHRRDGPRDNRNLYLASEGQIHEEGPAAQEVSRGDIQKRRRAKEEQALKLKNPNFFISRTRLQVRNVPVDTDQKELKRVFLDAVKRRATQANPRVLHARLLYDASRPDAAGKPRSRGIGFVEFEEHEHALAALRALNNNPDVFSKARRPIVEFAVEDARAVRKLERRRDGLQKAQKDRDEARVAAAGGSGAPWDNNDVNKNKNKNRNNNKTKQQQQNNGGGGAGAAAGGGREGQRGDDRGGGGGGEDDDRAGGDAAGVRTGGDAAASGGGKRKRKEDARGGDRGGVAGGGGAGGERQSQQQQQKKKQKTGENGAKDPSAANTPKAPENSAARQAVLPRRNVFGDADDDGGGAATGASQRPLEGVRKNRRGPGDKRDKLDDIIDKYFEVRGGGGGGKGKGKSKGGDSGGGGEKKPSLGRWFDY